MRISWLTLIALALFAVPALAKDDPDKGQILGEVTDAMDGAPLSGATVILKREATHTIVVGQTRADGRFAMSGLEPGDYALLIVLGDASERQESVPVVAGQVTHVSSQMTLAPDVITIHEKLPVTIAEPVLSTVKRILPYTDEAIDRDKWALGWLLLDIDARGKVTSFKFLHRPPLGLDKVAEGEVWGLRFKPARDASGAAVPSQRLWRMEWPSYWYSRVAVINPSDWIFVVHDRPVITDLRDGPNQLAAQILNGAGRFPRLKAHRPPCEGTGPLNLDSVDPVYRDCSLPDFDKIYSEAAVQRPADR